MKTKILASVVTAVVISGCAVKPEAITGDEMGAFTDANLQAIASAQEPIKGPVDMYEAMARALKYNLDFRVEQMNEALAMGDAELKSWDMLPKAVANAGWSRRSNQPGGSSVSLLTGIQSLQPSRSSERTSLSADLTFSWNILDFGLSYVRARQAADKVLIASERKRKVINRIIEDVRSAFWRAASEQRLASAMSRLERRVRRALANSRHLASSGQTSPLTALTYERELINIKKQLHELRRELKTAKMQLAALMNVAPGTSFTLALPRRRPTGLRLDMNMERMISIALQNRPELREAAYKKRINEKEAKAALLELLPGATVYTALNVDANDLLYNNNWVTWGAKASWNLMRLFRYPARQRQVEARERLLDAQAQALTMAVMTQVYVSRARYSWQKHILDATGQYYGVQRRILRQVSAAAATDAAGEQTLVREQMNTILAAARYDVAYAELQNAIANVYASMGLDPYGSEAVSDMPVKALAASLRRTWTSRNVAVSSGAS